MARSTGLEPATWGVEITRSIQLSYERKGSGLASGQVSNTCSDAAPSPYLIILLLCLLHFKWATAPG